MRPLTNCMYIQRYLAKDKAKVEAFGEHYNLYRWDFDWYIGEKKIGVIGNASAEAECFIDRILVADDKLIITPSQKRPIIERASESHAVMRGHDGGLEEIGKLLNLIQSNKVIHMYLSSSIPEGYDRILTFSPTKPSKELYEKGKILPVRINKDAVRRELELEQMFAIRNQPR
jgi:hypothetical protein